MCCTWVQEWCFKGREKGLKLCFLGVQATTRHAAVLFRIDSEEAQAKAYRKSFNPLTTEFFPPRRHIFVHTTFVSTAFLQHSLQRGQTWWGPHTWRDLSGNTVNDIHDPPQAQQSEVKGGCQPDFGPAFP